MSAEINLCPDQQATAKPATEIELCPDNPPAVDYEIQVCAGSNTGPTPSQCAGSDVLTITGADELESTTDYEQYTATGGIEPYTWSFDGGTISPTGQITSVTTCGGSSGNGAVGFVTVTDACGTSATIEIRLPGGSWVRVDSQYNPYLDGTFDGTPTASATCGDVWGIYDPGYIGTFYYSDVGGTRFSVGYGSGYYGSFQTDFERQDNACNWYPSGYPSFPWCFIYDQCETWFSGGDYIGCWLRGVTHEWRC